MENGMKEMEAEVKSAWVKVKAWYAGLTQNKKIAVAVGATVVILWLVW